MDNDKDPSRFGSPELQALIVERATEAKPSASAAPGIDPRQLHEFWELVIAYAKGVGTEGVALENHYIAAIAAAREEGYVKGFYGATNEHAQRVPCEPEAESHEWELLANVDFGEVLKRHPITMSTDGARLVADIAQFVRARLAAPEGASTWKSDGGYRCLNCGHGLTAHSGQLTCPQAKAPQQPPAGEDAKPMTIHCGNPSTTK